MLVHCVYAVCPVNLTAHAQVYLYVHPDSVANSVKTYRLLSIITEGSRAEP